MLSFIYRLCKDFSDQHGYWPNVLLISTGHLQALGDELGLLEDSDQLRGRLGLEVLVRKNAVHPSVIWMQNAARAAG